MDSLQSALRAAKFNETLVAAVLAACDSADDLLDASDDQVESTILASSGVKPLAAARFRRWLAEFRRERAAPPAGASTSTTTPEVAAGPDRTAQPRATTVPHSSTTSDAGAEATPVHASEETTTTPEEELVVGAYLWSLAQRTRRERRAEFMMRGAASDNSTANAQGPNIPLDVADAARALGRYFERRCRPRLTLDEASRACQRLSTPRTSGVGHGADHTQPSFDQIEEAIDVILESVSIAMLGGGGNGSAVSVTTTMREFRQRLRYNHGTSSFASSDPAQETQRSATERCMRALYAWSVASPAWCAAINALPDPARQRAAKGAAAQYPFARLSLGSSPVEFVRARRGNVFSIVGLPSETHGAAARSSLSLAEARRRVRALASVAIPSTHTDLDAAVANVAQGPGFEDRVGLVAPERAARTVDRALRRLAEHCAEYADVADVCLVAAASVLKRCRNPVAAQGVPKSAWAETLATAIVPAAATAFAARADSPAKRRDGNVYTALIDDWKRELARDDEDGSVGLAVREDKRRLSWVESLRASGERIARDACLSMAPPVRSPPASPPSSLDDSKKPLAAHTTDGGASSSDAADGGATGAPVGVAPLLSRYTRDDEERAAGGATSGRKREWPAAAARFSDDKLDDVGRPRKQRTRASFDIASTAGKPSPGSRQRGVVIDLRRDRQFAFLTRGGTVAGGAALTNTNVYMNFRDVAGDVDLGDVVEYSIRYHKDGEPLATMATKVGTRRYSALEEQQLMQLADRTLDEETLSQLRRLPRARRVHMLASLRVCLCENELRNPSRWMRNFKLRHENS
mmetsp:Transcript_5944/g.24884  ORF Transcript_5944/g.24884 Transcript_5944/m.24884 type:complete len:809 (+) Transcript_5944:276-2702(+)